MEFKLEIKQKMSRITPFEGLHIFIGEIFEEIKVVVLLHIKNKICNI
jgi:hypothetical protein